MAEFLELLASQQQQELDGEVFDLLLTLSDFAAFKVAPSLSFFGPLLSGAFGDACRREPF